ncbi:MAG: cadmium-translocating P-type ATPase [Clostridia bacterium]|nr:cadmium-translocating P-type ATPase [Clostridia bacterium]
MKKNEDIFKVFISGILLFVAFVFTKFLFPELPFFVKLLIYLPSYFVISYEVLFAALNTVYKKEFFDENVLMSIATIGALIMGYFAEAIFVMMFFAVGEIMEDIAENKSEKSIKSLIEICPEKARVIKEDGEIQKDAKDVLVGEILLVKAGERIPADGIIVEGETKIDNSALTGESMPVSAKSGAEVFSGTINLSATIKVEVTKTAEESSAAKIIELVKNATEKKTKTERFITKFARIYTPVVVSLAVIMAVVPSLFNGEWKNNLYSALAFLVVSCPCALVISVPLSFFGAVGCASKNGILVKGSDSLDKFAKLNNIVFDKTGTLTKGVFEVAAVHPQEADEENILKLAASVEKSSNHPIAKSIVSHYNGEEFYEALDVSEISGKGIIAKVKGKEVLIGNEKLMDEYGISYKECHRFGTTVHISLKGVYLGHIVISDTVKEGAKETVEAINSMKRPPVMLTGDGEETAKAVAEDLGINIYKYSLLPDDKVSEVENIIKDGKTTAFIGDGINDAPVLARADVGVAMGGLGSDAAIDAADVVIMNDDIRKIPLLIKIAEKSQRIARENIVFSIGIKVLVLLLSAFGLPYIMWLAAFADAGVLVLAVLNAIRTLKI